DLSAGDDDGLVVARGGSSSVKNTNVSERDRGRVYFDELLHVGGESCLGCAADGSHKQKCGNETAHSELLDEGRQDKPTLRLRKAQFLAARAAHRRSEERRVGKECR